MPSSPITPPDDPRASWSLPPPGQMPQVATLDGFTVRVLAPNASPMTLDGTNTYLLGEPGVGAVVVVDPGPRDPEHRDRVAAVVEQRDAEVTAILVTHHHVDHAEAAEDWSSRFGAPIVASTAQVAGSEGRTVAHGDRLVVGGAVVEVVATPGHTRDHLAFRLPTGALLTGDHVLGRGTSVVAHPDGDLVAYLDSLRRVLDLGPDALFPGHGPELTEDPSAVLRYYDEHRRFRREQLRAALEDGPADPAALVARIYLDVDRRLLPAAEASTRAALDAMVREGVVRWDASGRALLDGA